jgi:transcriptional regulator GlxA family with amidase domain
VLNEAVYRMPAKELGVDRRIEVAIEIIQVELARKMTVAYLAKRVNLSPWHFCHLFKAETSVTPKQFVKSCRLGKARQLLAGSFLTVKEIASKVGFEDRSHFTRSFKESSGQPPTRYRSLAVVPLDRRPAQQNPYGAPVQELYAMGDTMKVPSSND